VASIAQPKRQAEVLEAAVTVFHRDGYDAASVQSIADELGILRGSLYHYIEAKEDLLFANLLRAHRDVEAILAEVRRLDATPLERLYAYTRRQVEYTTSTYPTMAVYHRDADKLSADRRRVLAARWRRHERFVVDCIEAAQARGEADPSIPAPALARALVGSLIGVSRWYRPDGRLGPAEVARQCADFALAGLRGRP
jgi:AcrR family transcriptional regulator